MTDWGSFLKKTSGGKGDEWIGSIEMNNIRAGFISDKKNQQGEIIVGNPPADGLVPPEYLIRIRSKLMGIIIYALLQEKISMRVGGQWEPFSGQGALWVTSPVFQAIFGATTAMPWMTRRAWRGTTPMTISLNLRFEAVSDAQREVIDPCMALQMLSLPYTKKWIAGQATYDVMRNYINTLLPEKKELLPKEIDTLVPPGPSAIPTVLEGDNIRIDIGNFLTFDRVIVSDVSTDFDVKFTREGMPISSSVTVQFETYEVLTKQTLEAAYTGNPIVRTAAEEPSGAQRRQRLMTTSREELDVKIPGAAK